MSDSIVAREAVFRFPVSQRVACDAIDRWRYEALAAELRASRELLQRQVMLAREFEHRVVNGLQLIANLLSAQSRTMPTPEARNQLSIAARRVVALGTVHHRLHLLDRPANVDLKGFLVTLCDDLSDLFFPNRSDHAIVVEGPKIEISSSLASALGLITNELITNSVKHANGDITVRLEKNAPGIYSLSVLDGGPGLLAGDDAANSKGLGMKLVIWLVEQIGGHLHATPRGDGHRTCFTVTFASGRNPTALS